MAQRPKEHRDHPHYQGIDRKDEYDPESYYMRSTDARGHATSMNVKVEPLMMHFIKTVINNDLVPYQSPADFIRDALIHRGHELLEKMPGLGPQAAEFWALNRLEIERQMWAEKIKRELFTVEWIMEAIDSASTPTEKDQLLNNARKTLHFLAEPRAKVLEKWINDQQQKNDREFEKLLQAND